MAKEYYPVSQADAPELIGQIIDIFEDFLEERHVVLNNDERDEDLDAAIIYGSDYGILQDQLQQTFRFWQLIPGQSS